MNCHGQVQAFFRLDEVIGVSSIGTEIDFHPIHLAGKLPDGVVVGEFCPGADVASSVIEPIPTV